MRALALLLVAVPLLAQIAENPPILYSVGGTLTGEFFGDGVDVLGDVNGDGVADFAAGAPFGSGGGRAVICSGRDGSILRQIAAPRPGQFGWEVIGAGDVDRDGAPDLIVGSPAADSNRGAVYVFSGRTGAQLRSFNGDAAGDRFGERVARLGDLDRDGVPEMIVGAQTADANGRDSGAAYVYSGGTGERIALIPGAAAGAFLGGSVGGIRDVDGDSVPDILLGAHAGGAHRTGQVIVVSGADRRPLLTVDGESDGSTFTRHYIGDAGDVDRDGVFDIITADIGYHGAVGRAYVISGRSGAFVYTYTGSAAEEFFGTGSKRIGDMDGDGVEDLFVGAAFFGGQVGKAFVHSGRDGSLLASFTGTRGGATLGARGLSLGDVDGDGRNDLLVTAPTDSSTARQAGRVYVISGSAFPRAAPPPPPGPRRRAVR